MGMSSMKVHQFARGLWDSPTTTLEPSLTLGCKRLRPLAPKLADATTTTTTLAPFDLKSFIRPESGPRNKLASPHEHEKKDSSHSQVYTYIQFAQIYIKIV